MKYGYEALFKNEYTGLQIVCSLSSNGTHTAVDGSVCIDEQGFNDNLSIFICGMILLMMMFTSMLSGYVALYCLTRKEHKPVELKYSRPSIITSA